MKIKPTLIFACIFITFLGCNTLNIKGNDPNKEMDNFIAKLMKEMTIEEKIGQLNLLVANADDGLITGEAQNSNLELKIKKGEVGGMFGSRLKSVKKIRQIQQLAMEESRLKIPLLFGLDVIHGYETVFPIPLGLAASWDMQAIEKSARIAAIEASANGLCWVFSPMVDICRDPRWGRIAESAGEDPYLGSEIAKAMVRGYQGDFSRSDNVLACIKHFALYGAAEAGRDYNTTDMSRLRMYNEYFPPYKAAVDAGAGSVMASFNDVDGIPATANPWLMTEVLRKQWGFNGFVVSDYTGIDEMIQHGIGDSMEVSVRTLKAGVDMDMVSEYFLKNLKTALNEGKVSERDIDSACRRILEAKYKLGLFQNPYKYCDAERAKTEVYTDEHHAAARKIASESFVLFKNSKNTLPLKKSGNIALVGPLANNRANMLGTWSIAADFDKPATLLEALRTAVGNSTNIRYAKGSHLTTDSVLEARFVRDKRWSLGRESEKRSDTEMLNEALHIASQSDVIVAALGESAEMSGESSSRSDLNIPDAQQTLLKELLKTGKPVVLVLFTGRPLTLTWENEHVPAILNVWFGGSETASAIADVLFGDVNPSGKLTVSFPKNVGQIPVYYNHKNTGRPMPKGQNFTKFRTGYLDVDNEPLYPFGFGLSYTQFEYSDVKLNASEMTRQGKITASVTVSNRGKYDGKEVVQLYIRDMEGSITRPVKELKGFQKIFLQAGESKTVSFDITPEMLKFYNYDLEYICEAGEFSVMIGGNSRDVKTARFRLK